MTFDASPSWSGFNYQGKVALYHALRLINEKPVDTDWSKHTLLLESTEDFEIIDNGNPVSFHQVKAYNSSSYSKYSDALLGITLELYRNPDVAGRIHTWQTINNKPKCANLISSIKDDLNTIISEFKNKNPKDGSTTLEKAADTSTNKPKTAAILHSAFNGDSAAQMCARLESIQNATNNALSRLESYIYDDGKNFCDLDKINTKIEKEINNNFYTKGIVGTPEQLEKTFHWFLGMIDRYIIERHKTVQQNTKTPITFDVIVESLQIDHEDIGNEYLAIKFKERFARVINEYMSDEEEYIEPAKGMRCNLKEASKRLLGLSSIELWASYRNFSPQIHLQHTNNTDNAIEIDLNGIRHVLLKILDSINIDCAYHRPIRNQFIYRTTSLPHQHYLPTTILNLARAKQIEKYITTNPNMSEILFEVENLIYTGQAPHSFSPALIVHTEAPIAIEADVRPKRNEILPTITLVPLTTAKDALA